MTTTPGQEPSLFLFGSATLVFWAEEAAMEEGVPVEVVPAPPGSPDLCGLALQTPAGEAERLRRVLEVEGIPYRVGA